MSIGVYIFESPESKRGYFLDVFSDLSFQVTFLQTTSSKDPWKTALHHSRDRHPTQPLLLVKGNSFSTASSEIFSEILQNLKKLPKWRALYLGWNNANCEAFEDPVDIGLSKIYSSDQIKNWQAVLLSPDLVGDLRQLFNSTLEDHLKKQDPLVFYPPIFLPEPSDKTQVCMPKANSSKWWLWILLFLVILIIWWAVHKSK